MENLPDAPEIDKIKPSSGSAPGFVMKLALMLVMIIVVVFFVRIGIAIVFHLKSPSKSPYLIDGMVPGDEARTIQQNPALDNSVPIFRSKNEASGMEFTWSLWLWITSGEVNFKSTNNNQWKHVFHKGNNSIIDADGGSPTQGSSDLKYGDDGYEINYDYSYEQGMAWPNNSPGLYLDSTTNQLKFVMSTFAQNSQTGGAVTTMNSNEEVNQIDDSTYGDITIMEQIDISNIPVDKWVCLVIRAKNTVIDVYVNGTITNRHYPQGVMKQTYYDVHIGQNGGFNGYISRLKYDNNALSAVEIQNIYKKGPKTKLVYDNSQPKYDKITNLSHKWYGY
tara:strand:+ start:3252 stop:4256 length:1005 start_codon:yes stop_codon:yes gene_type:complete